MKLSKNKENFSSSLIVNKYNKAANPPTSSRLLIKSKPFPLGEKRMNLAIPLKPKSPSNVMSLQTSRGGPTRVFEMMQKEYSPI